MATSCATPQNLCSMFRGDTLPFSFQFNDTDGQPIDISGMKLYFTMKADATSDDGGPGDLQDSVTFPSDAQSALGQGELIIPASLTALLIPGTNYHFDFQLVDGTTIATMGIGQILVDQDITGATT